MKSVNELLPDLRIEAANMPEIVVKRLISDTVQNFCEKTGVYSEEISLSIPAGNESAPIAPSDGVIFDVPRVDVNGLRVKRLSGIGGNKRGYLYDLGSLFVYPVSQDVSSVVAKALLKTDRGATEFPDFIIDDYRDAIIAGSLERISRRPGGSWHNPDVYALNRKFYAEEISRVKKEVMSKMDMTSAVKRFV